MISKKCRVCGSVKLKKFFSLGSQPLANNLAEKKNKKLKTYPLELNVCKSCFNCQLSYIANPKKIFLKYLYRSSISKAFEHHFELACKKYISMFKLLKNKSTILDVGSNDGIALKPFKKRGFKNIFGIEPSKNLAKITKKLKIKTFNKFFDSKISKKFHEKCDLITATNVFAHVDDVYEMAKNILFSLKTHGVFIIEVQYLANMFKDQTFDNIYHEHVNYWYVKTIEKFFTKLKASIFRVEKINTHGGSIRVFIKKNINKKIKKHKSVSTFISQEEQLGMNRLKIFKKFNKLVLQKKKFLKKNFNKLYKKNKIIIGFGAPAKATTLINYLKIQKYISYIIDDNPLKNNKFIPNTNIKIINKPKDNFVDCVIVFAWNYFNEIKRKNKKLTNNFINLFGI